jgi:hypothetical protein
LAELAKMLSLTAIANSGLAEQNSFFSLESSIEWRNWHNFLVRHPRQMRHYRCFSLALLLAFVFAEMLASPGKTRHFSLKSLREPPNSQKKIMSTTTAESAMAFYPCPLCVSVSLRRCFCLLLLAEMLYERR